MLRSSLKSKVVKLFFDFSFERSSFPWKKLDSRIWTGSLLSSPEILSRPSLKMRVISSF
jgi:hypothetical protein